MNRQEIMAKVAAWMLARGRKQKLTKRRDFEQSLFEHTLAELGA
jgi:GH24 family phage-related lysozyme (muramidase)